MRTRFHSHLPEALRVLSLLAVTTPNFNEEFKEVLKNSKYHSPTIRENITHWDKEIPSWANMQVPADSIFVSETHKKFEVPENSIFIAPGSVWATKRWTLSGFTKVAEELSKKGLSVFFTGDDKDAQIAKDIVKAVPKAKNLCGKTSLLELHALFSKAQKVISNDSSPIHMAALAGAPVLSIFGPTTLGLGYRPWTDESVVVQKNLDCRPCGKHGHHKCPIDTHACMTDIRAEDVLKFV